MCTGVQVYMCTGVQVSGDMAPIYLPSTINLVLSPKPLMLINISSIMSCLLNVLSADSPNTKSSKHKYAPSSPIAGADFATTTFVTVFFFVCSSQSCLMSRHCANIYFSFVCIYWKFSGRVWTSYQGLLSILRKCSFSLSKMPSYNPWQNALIQNAFFKRVFWIREFCQGI